MKKVKTLKFLIFGDIFGSLGRKLVNEQLPDLKKKYHPDLVIANAENLTHGSGTSKKVIQELSQSGVDFFTGGNHSFDNAMAKDVFSDPELPVIRPANWPGVIGEGYKIVEINGSKILIINLIGRLFVSGEYENPFEVAENILSEQADKSFAAILVDFHAEATSEAYAMGYFLDGKVSMVYGTHTHVSTEDQRVLPQGTGFISDVGMTGPYDSVIGMKPGGVVEKFRYPEKKVKIEIEDSGRGILNALLVEVDPQNKKCLSIKKINQVI